MSFLKTISSNDSDAELVQRYKNGGHLTTLGELYQRYMELVYGVCLRYLKNPEDAKDSVLAIFEELIKKLQKHDVVNFKSWLYQVAKNHCLMRLRSTKNIERATVDLESVQLEENVHLYGVLEEEEKLNQLDYCLSRLSAEQKDVVELFYKKGKCYNQIAEQTGLDWKAVRSAIQNGRRNLKKCIEKESIKSTLK